MHSFTEFITGLAQTIEGVNGSPLTVDAEVLRNIVFAIETNLQFVAKRTSPDAADALKDIFASLEKMKELLRDK